MTQKTEKLTELADAAAQSGAGINSEALSEELERESRRYSRALTEEEEARLR